MGIKIANLKAPEFLGQSNNNARIVVCSADDKILYRAYFVTPIQEYKNALGEWECSMLNSPDAVATGIVFLVKTMHENSFKIVTKLSNEKVNEVIISVAKTGKLKLDPNWDVLDLEK